MWIRNILPDALCRFHAYGLPDDRIQQVIAAGWEGLIQEKRLLDSPSYLKENGKAVVAIAGMIDSQASFPHPGLIWSRLWVFQQRVQGRDTA